MRETRAASGTARAVAVFAMLAGLFFMHGLPSQGCPGGSGLPAMPAMSASAAPASSTGDGGAVPAMTAPAPSGASSPAVPMDQVNAGGHGGLCVSTPAPQGPTALVLLGLAALAMVLLSVASPGMSVPALGLGTRPPPISGSIRLTRLCVSRT